MNLVSKLTLYVILEYKQQQPPSLILYFPLLINLLHILHSSADSLISFQYQRPRCWTWWLIFRVVFISVCPFHSLLKFQNYNSKSAFLFKLKTFRLYFCRSETLDLVNISVKGTVFISHSDPPFAAWTLFLPTFFFYKIPDRIVGSGFYDNT